MGYLCALWYSWLHSCNLCLCLALLFCPRPSRYALLMSFLLNLALSFFRSPAFLASPQVAVCLSLLVLLHAPQRPRLVLLLLLLFFNLALRDTLYSAGLLPTLL